MRQPATAPRPAEWHGAGLTKSYVLFAIGIALQPLKRTAALATAFAALLVVTTLARVSEPPFAFWADPIVFEFVLGCLIGALDLKGLLARAPRWAAVALLIVGVGVFVGCADILWHRLFARGVGAFLIVAGAVAMERTGAFAFRWRIPLFLGDASYSIYLGHLFPVIGFRVLWEKLHLSVATPLQAAAFLGLCVGVGVGAGCLLYLFVEKPLTRLARRAVWPSGGRKPLPAAS
ncbi:hypothetical protein BH09PSE2_BH09PSE2_06070 [soil metagenome]